MQTFIGIYKHVALSREEKLDIAEKCLSSTAVMCKTIFPERFEYEWSDAHREVCALLDDDTIPFLAIAAWRGFGKSSLVHIGHTSRRIAARDKKYIVPVSATSTLSIAHSENLKRELMRNPNFVEIFGSMRTNDSFAKDQWIANNPTPECPGGTMVLPRGCGQQVRGILYDGHRPDLIIIDDLEDRETVMNPDQRLKNKEFLFQDLLGCLDRSRHDFRVIYIGTVMHDDSLLCALLKNPSWTKVRYELCDDDFNSNWPQRFSSADIKRIHDDFCSLGLEDAFYMEYRNLPQSQKNKPIMREHFKYFDISTLPSTAMRVVLVDPAKTATSTACDTAIVVAAADPVTNRIFFIDAISDKMHPDRMYEESYAMCVKYNTPYLAVEVTGLNEHIVWPYRNFLRMKSTPINFIELKARKGPSQYVPHGSQNFGKDSRIGASLVPMYRQGLVYHVSAHPLLARFESQLLDFPRSADVDMIDAFSYITQFLSQGEVYMRSNTVDTTYADWDEILRMSVQREDEALSKLYGRNVNKMLAEARRYDDRY